ncbi:MAG: hypothetical protein WBR26_12245 [Candidatus Acidiferrum sp.]
MEKANRNNAQARLSAALVKRTSRNIAGEIAAQGGEFVIDPEIKFRAMPPKGERAEYEDGVTETSEKAESWTGTPVKHKTSPRLGGKNQASS